MGQGKGLPEGASLTSTKKLTVHTVSVAPSSPLPSLSALPSTPSLSPLPSPLSPLLLPFLPLKGPCFL